LTSGKFVGKRFFNLLIFSIYSSLYELIGQEGWSIVWRTGEVAYAQIKQELKITEKDPVQVTRKVGKFLEEEGYGSKFIIKELSKTELIHEIHDGAARPAILKLREKFGENAVLPHFSTSIMFAALKDSCNLRVKIVQLQVAPTEIGVTREKWVLSRIDD